MGDGPVCGFCLLPINDGECGCESVLERANRLATELTALRSRLAKAEAVAIAASALIEYWKAHHPILLQAELGKPLNAVVAEWNAARTDGGKDKP